VSAPSEPPAIQIRRAGPADSERLALIGQATFVETFAGVLDGDDIVAHCAAQHSAAHYAGALGDGVTSAWLAELGRAPVGFVTTSRCTLPVADVGPDDVEVKRIYVLHRFHGQRVGDRLLRAALDEARAAGKRRALLGVYAGNQRAIAFYTRQGFYRAGQRQFQVGANRYDDIVLAREL
jgi:ribosomal protein S18 acetylase RimI-like enzyme